MKTLILTEEKTNFKKKAKTSHSWVLEGKIVLKRSQVFCLKFKLENLGCKSKKSGENLRYELHESMEQPGTPSYFLGRFTLNSGKMIS